IASATGIRRQALDYMKENANSVLVKHHNKYGQLNAEDVFYFADQENRLNEEVIEYTTKALGFILANAATVIDPSVITIGGGVSNAGAPLLNRIAYYFKKYALSRIYENCEIKLAQLGNDAGIIGASCLVKKEVQKSLT